MTRTKRKRKATALSRQSADPAWQTLDSKIGGRKGLLSLALASSLPKAAILAELCMDKAFSKAGTKALARKAGFTEPEIVDLYRDHKQLEAILELHENLPEIVKDAATDAKSSQVPCENCQGKPIAADGTPCYVCSGTGKVRKAGDKDKLQFVGEASGLVGKKGLQINTQVNVNTNSGRGESFESLLRRATVKIERKQVEGVIEAETND